MKVNERGILKVLCSAIAAAFVASAFLVVVPSKTHTQELEERKPLEYRLEEPDVKIGRREQQEIKCLKEALWHEARGEGEEGLKAVLTVIVNRKNHPDYPGTFCRVIRQPRQFSYLTEVKRLEPAPAKEEKKILAKIEQLAYDAVLGNFSRTLPAAVLWYHNSKVKPGWSRAKIQVKSIGQHKFYKSKIQKA